MIIFQFWVVMKELSRGVVVLTFDLAVAFANSGMDWLTCVAIKIESEGLLRLAGWTCVSGRLAFIGLQVWSFVHK